MRAACRWVASDLRSHGGQAALTGAIVAGVVAWLVLAAMLLEGANSPWLGLYDRTHGPDVVVYLAPGTAAGGLATLSGVREASTPVAAGTATLEQGGTATLGQGDTQVELRAMPAAGPAMLTPLVVAGSWLSAARPNGVVVEASFAAAARLTVGALITLPGPGHAAVSAQVIGIAETSGQIPYPQWTPGLAWVTPALLHRVALQPGTAQEVIGLRLADRCPVCVTDAVDEVSSAVQPQNVLQSVSWQQVSQAMAADGWLLGEAPRPVRPHRARSGRLRPRQRHRRPGDRPAPVDRDAQGDRVHPRPGSRRAPRREPAARRRRHGRWHHPRLGAVAGRARLPVRPWRHSGHARPAARRADGAHCRRHRGRGRHRYRGPGLAGCQHPGDRGGDGEPRRAGSYPGSRGSGCSPASRPRSSSAPATRSPGGHWRR